MCTHPHVPAAKVGLPVFGFHQNYDLNEYCKHQYFMPQLLFSTDLSNCFPQTSLLADSLVSMYKIEGLLYFKYALPILDFNFKGKAVSMCPTI